MDDARRAAPFTGTTGQSASRARAAVEDVGALVGIGYIGQIATFNVPDYRPCRVAGHTPAGPRGDSQAGRRERWDRQDAAFSGLLAWATIGSPN